MKQQTKLDAIIKFHYENPLIYQLFKKYTFERIRKGHTKFSAEAVINRIRWEAPVKSKGEEYKIPNEMKAFYSRLFCIKHNKHYELFNKRNSITDQINYTKIHEIL